MTDELYRACRQAVHVITAEGEILRAGRASMYVLAEIGYPRWLIRPLIQPPLVWFTELGYRFVADNRSFFSKFMFTREE